MSTNASARTTTRDTYSNYNKVVSLFRRDCNVRQPRTLEGVVRHHLAGPKFIWESTWDSLCFSSGCVSCVRRALPVIPSFHGQQLVHARGDTFRRHAVRRRHGADRPRCAHPARPLPCPHSPSPRTTPRGVQNLRRISFRSVSYSTNTQVVHAPVAEMEQAKKSMQKHARQRHSQQVELLVSSLAEFPAE